MNISSRAQFALNYGTYGMSIRSQKAADHVNHALGNASATHRYRSFMQLGIAFLDLSPQRNCAPLSRKYLFAGLAVVVVPCALFPFSFIFSLSPTVGFALVPFTPFPYARVLWLGLPYIGSGTAGLFRPKWFFFSG